MLPSRHGQIAALRDRHGARRTGAAGLLRTAPTGWCCRNSTTKRNDDSGNSARSSKLARLAAAEGEMRAQAALTAIEAELGVLLNDAPAGTDGKAPSVPTSTPPALAWLQSAIV